MLFRSDRVRELGKNPKKIFVIKTPRQAEKNHTCCQEWDGFVLSCRQTQLTDAEARAWESSVYGGVYADTAYNVRISYKFIKKANQAAACCTRIETQPSIDSRSGSTTTNLATKITKRGRTLTVVGWAMYDPNCYTNDPLCVKPPPNCP